MLKTILKKAVPHGILRKRMKYFYKIAHINRALQHCNGNIYMEIGVRDGTCFRQIKTNQKIGVDPVKLPVDYILGPNESFFEMTSDEFFDSNAREILKGKSIAVAFVDGLHEFTQVFRDIRNLEPYMASDGIIFIHDCNPMSQDQAGDYPDGMWNGDVWKVAYYLRTYRKDLCFFTLDCDYGLGVLTGFHNTSVLESPTEKVIAQIKNLEYIFLQKNRKQVLKLRPAWYSLVFFSIFGPIVYRAMQLIERIPRPKGSAEPYEN